MLIKSNLIIDGGGTSSKGIVLETGEIFSAGPGNVSLNFKDSIKNYEVLFKRISQKYLIDKIKIYAAGYASSADEIKINFKKAMVSIFGNDEIKIDSDSVMALESFGKKTSSITLGTGTSITTNIHNKIELFYGLGHLVFEPMSGLGIMRRFITKINNIKDKNLMDITMKYLGFKSSAEFLRYIYANPNDKKVIAKPFYELLNDKKTKGILLEVIENEFDLFNSPEIEEVLNNSKNIVLNGSVARNEIISKLFSNKYKNQKFYKDDTFYEIAKRIEEKW